MRNRFIGDFTEPPEHLCSFMAAPVAGAALASAAAPTIATAAIGTSALPVGMSFASFAAPALASTTTLASAATAGGVLAGVGAAAKAAAPYLSAAGTLVNVLGQVQAGRNARAQGAAMQKAAEYEAERMKDRANAERAIGQRKAINERRRTEFAQSALQARAAASGAGLGPGVVDLAGDIEQEGEFRALNALYEGEERARGLDTSASLSRFEGDQYYKAGKTRARGYYMGAAGAGLDRGASLFEKYG